MNVGQLKCIQSFGRETGANYTAWKIQTQVKVEVGTDNFMKAYRGSGGVTPLYLTSAIDGLRG